MRMQVSACECMWVHVSACGRRGGGGMPQRCRSPAAVAWKPAQALAAVRQVMKSVSGPSISQACVCDLEAQPCTTEVCTWRFDGLMSEHTTSSLGCATNSIWSRRVLVGWPSAPINVVAPCVVGAINAVGPPLHMLQVLGLSSTLAELSSCFTVLNTAYYGRLNVTSMTLEGTPGAWLRARVRSQTRVSAHLVSRDVHHGAPGRGFSRIEISCRHALRCLKCSHRPDVEPSQQALAYESLPGTCCGVSSMASLSFRRPPTSTWFPSIGRRGR